MQIRGPRHQSEYKKPTPRILDSTHDHTLSYTIVKISIWSIMPLLKIFLFLWFYNSATTATHTQTPHLVNTFIVPLILKNLEIKKKMRFWLPMIRRSHPFNSARAKEVRRGFLFLPTQQQMQLSILIPLLAKFALVEILSSKIFQTVTRVDDWALIFQKPTYKSLSSSLLDIFFKDFICRFDYEHHCTVRNLLFTYWLLHTDSNSYVK